MWDEVEWSEAYNYRIVLDGRPLRWSSLTINPLVPSQLLGVLSTPILLQTHCFAHRQSLRWSSLLTVLVCWDPPLAHSSAKLWLVGSEQTPDDSPEASTSS